MTTSRTRRVAVAALLAIATSVTAPEAGPQNTATQNTETQLRARAARGDEAAQLELGVRYLVGEAVTQDPVEAERWLRMAAEQGNAVAQHHLGHIYQGVPEPFRTAQDVPVDHAESVRWFQRSAEQGNVPAATSLATKYRDGHGVPASLDQAFRWFLRAAELGNVAAMTEVGVLYAAGNGVAQDDMSAYMWLDLATRYAGGEDREFVLMDREGVAQRLNARQIAEAERRANEWTPAAPR
jgi:uncharacterized protein